MNKSIPPLASETYLSIIAVVIALALLAVPICAPLCAAKTCSSNASNEHCHEMASMGADSGEHFLAPAKSCGSFEISAVLVKADERGIDSQRVRNALSGKILGVRAEQSQRVAFSNSILSSARRVPLGLANSLQLTAVLRI
jgi:hypothetical protein